MANGSTGTLAPGAASVDTHVARQLRRLRVARCVTQTQLATGLGVSTQLIHKYEASRTRISPGRLYLCAKLLDVPVSYFFEPLQEVAGPPPLPPRRPARELIWDSAATSHD
jgi:transcriptional regulator with XRE-family HTH domain